MSALSWDKCVQFAMPWYIGAVGAFAAAWNLRDKQPGRPPSMTWQSGVLLMICGVFLVTALVMSRLAFIRHPSQEHRQAIRQLGQSYLRECTRPPEFISLAQIYDGTPESIPAGSRAASAHLRPPKLLPETKRLLETVLGAERTVASLDDLGDLIRFMKEKSPQLARKGLLRWRKATLQRLTVRTAPALFSISESMRVPALTDIRLSFRQGQKSLLELMELFDRIHGSVQMNKAIDGSSLPEPLPADSKPSSYSLAYTEFERDGGNVYLKVTNRGIASATFWALIEPSGPMIDIPDGSCARWVHSDDAKASIPSGEARKLKIARFDGLLYGYGTWRIPYSLDNNAQAVTSPHPLQETGLLMEMRLRMIDVTITLRADPELRGGAIIRRVLLDSSGHLTIKD